MSQISRSTTIARVPARNLRLAAAFGGAAAVIAGAALALAFAGNRADVVEPTRAGGAVPALTRMDDYGLRLAPQAPALTRMDDYGLRLAPQAPALGPMDDYGLRHALGE
jgi:hypothetical protein